MMAACSIARSSIWKRYFNRISACTGRFGREKSVKPVSSLSRTPGQRVACAEGFLQRTKATMSPSQAIDFLTLLQQLKTTKRTGWVRKGVRDPESISDHMYRMGIMSLMASEQPDVDTTKCLKLALVHDIAEAIIGDLTPSDGYTKQEKYELEYEAMLQMKRMLGANPAGPEFESLWREYEEGVTKEAQLVKDFDKVEMILQAQEYEEQQGINLQEFFDSTDGKLKTGLAQAWANEILRRRKPAT